MTSKTLEELRASAKARGIKGFSKMPRQALEQMLAGADKHPLAAKTVAKSPAKKKTAPHKTQSVRSAAKPAPSANIDSPPAFVAVPAKSSDFQQFSGQEERVENAKYATILNGGVSPAYTFSDLGEDIDNLPPVSEPMLCLLPQKPGVLHGYWVLPPNSTANLPLLKLRLGRVAGDTLEIIQEFALSHARGRRYFHLDEAENVGAVYLQLGYYQADGQFVTAIRRGIARIPSLYSSQITDRLWWVNDEQFRAMYLRAGGFLRGPRLGWSASISSPGGARSVSSDRLAWPGNISSP